MKAAAGCGREITDKARRGPVGRARAELSGRHGATARLTFSPFSAPPTPVSTESTRSPRPS
jgi:hypothetical protein